MYPSGFAPRRLYIVPGRVRNHEGVYYEGVYPGGYVSMRVCILHEVVYSDGVYPGGFVPRRCVQFSWVYPPSVYQGGCVFLRVGTQ